MSPRPVRLRPGRPFRTLGLVLLLVPGLLAVPLNPARAATTAAPSSSCAAEASDATAAAAMAVACGQRVEVLAARTETTQVFANPDGTGTIEQYAQPQRVRHTGGGWSTLDPTLTVGADGLLTTRATPVKLTLSNGGDGPLVRARRDGGEVSLSWLNGSVPKPTIDGATATYADIYPGVDLVVTALKTGFREVLVVKNRAAAANPALRQVAFGTKLSGLRWQEQSGDLVAVDAANRPVFGASAPRMWDSSTTPAAARTAAVRRARSSVSGPATGARNAKMPVEIRDGKITLAPDRDLLTDPAAVYPIYLDPTVTYTSWTMINSRYTSQSYWSYDKEDCPGRHTGECAKVGYTDAGPTMAYRSMWQFPTSGFKGKQILNAQFTIDLLHSWQCSKSTTELRRVNSTLSSGTTWSNTASDWSGSNVATVYNESCDQARVPTEFAIKSLITSIAASSASYVTLGLKAATETNHSGWKKFDADVARLVVQTNTVPNAPTSLTVDGKACVVGSGRPYTSTATPSLRANVSDADRNSLTASFEWARIRYDGTYGPISDPKAQSSVPSGSTALVTSPAGVIDKGDLFVATGDWDGDGVTDALARDPSGVLYLLPGKGTVLTSRVKIGSGWAGYSVAGVADWDDDGHLDIIARQNSTNELWLYPGESKRGGATQGRHLLSTGWSGYSYAGVVDWDRDGHQDVLARDSGGTLWLYPGQGGRNTGIVNADRVSLGGGWGSTFRYHGALDWDRDGKADVIVSDSTGDQWLYPGNGARATLYPYVRHQIGSGWSSYSALVMPDLNGDGKADLLAESDGKTWYAYPGSGGHTSSGSRWTVGVTGISDGAYAFRAKASDAYKSGDYSGWCEFEVDQTNPESPVVTADTYHAGSTGCPVEGCGSVGHTGSFTFDSISHDVVSYKWGFSDPPSTTAGAPAPGEPVTVQWTPTSGGAKTLYVQAVDKAGRFASSTHQFYVAPPSPALARWKFSEPSGSTVAYDDTGNGKALLVHGAPQAKPGRFVGGANALRFDGIFDYAGTGDQIIQDTSRSFSVAAWVKLDDKNSQRTIVTQAGDNTHAFVLEYVLSTDTWQFTVTSADVSVPTHHGASSAPGAPKVGVWTHLVGTFDSAAGELRLYVDGQLTGSKTGVSTWDADGTTYIGGQSHRFCGSLTDVQAWDRVLSASEASTFTDTIADSSTTMVARWDLEEVGPGPSFDASNYYHDLDFYGGAEIPPSGSGHTGTGLLLDGADDYAETLGPVLHTDQSFTISAWARLPGDIAGNRTVLAQRGDTESGVFIKYEATQDRWHCVYGDIDNTTQTGVYSGSTEPVAKEVWTHLVCIYDAPSGLLTLYVNGAAQNTVGVPNPWRAGGPMMLGRVQWRAGMFEYWSGSIDEVRVYQGVVKDLTRIP